MSLYTYQINCDKNSFKIQLHACMHIVHVKWTYTLEVTGSVDCVHTVTGQKSFIRLDGYCHFLTILIFLTRGAPFKSIKKTNYTGQAFAIAPLFMCH